MKQPMQRIQLKSLDGEKRKLTLIGPPWVPVGETIYLHGKAWKVEKAQRTTGVTLPGFGSPALPAKPDKQKRSGMSPTEAFAKGQQILQERQK